MTESQPEGSAHRGDAAIFGHSRWRPIARWVPPGTWTREGILEALRDWFELTGERPRIYYWRPEGDPRRGGDSPGRRLWERQHPRWPSASTVVGEFGSWVEALESAGLPVPSSRHAEGTLAERVAAARRLARAGLLQKEIADCSG